MGAHEEGPSGTSREGAPDLAAVVAADPEGELGDECVERFGPRLPFLLKVLAPGRAISIQAHPTAEQAAGAATTGDGVYVDDWAKPELLLAIAPFEVFVGMRTHAEVATLGGPAQRAAAHDDRRERRLGRRPRARAARRRPRDPGRGGGRLRPRGRGRVRPARGRGRRPGRRERGRRAGRRGAPRRHRPRRAAAHAPPGAPAGGVHRRRGRGAPLLRAGPRHRGACELRQRRARRADLQGGQRARAAAHRRPRADGWSAVAGSSSPASRSSTAPPTGSCSTGSPPAGRCPTAWRRGSCSACAAASP